MQNGQEMRVIGDLVSGYCVLIGGNLFSCKSTKQTIVARSSTKAKYRAMAHTTCELLG